MKIEEVFTGASWIGVPEKQYNLRNMPKGITGTRVAYFKKGLFDSNEQESELRRIMMNQASRIVLLCDSSKFDKLSFSKISSFERIHYLITDIKPSKEWIDFLSGNKVTLLHG